MKYVFDSCVGIKALLPETLSEKAIALLDDFKNQIHELIAPDTFPVSLNLCERPFRTQRLGKPLARLR